MKLNQFMTFNDIYFLVVLGNILPQLTYWHQQLEELSKKTDETWHLQRTELKIGKFCWHDLWMLTFNKIYLSQQTLGNLISKFFFYFWFTCIPKYCKILHWHQNVLMERQCLLNQLTSKCLLDCNVLFFHPPWPVNINMIQYKYLHRNLHLHSYVLLSYFWPAENTMVIHKII